MEVGIHIKPYTALWLGLSPRFLIIWFLNPQLSLLFPFPTNLYLFCQSITFSFRLWSGFLLIHPWVSFFINFIYLLLVGKELYGQLYSKTTLISAKLDIFTLNLKLGKEDFLISRLNNMSYFLLLYFPFLF